MGVGPLDPSSGIDVWLRVVHAVRARRPDLSARWLLTEGVDPDPRFLDAIAHERWHLDLDDGLDIVGPEQRDALVAASGAATAIAVTARPPVGEDAGEDAGESASWPAALRLAQEARATIVGFGGGAVPAPDQRIGIDVELIDYPDADALADAVVRVVSAADAGVTQPSGRSRRARSSTRRW